MAAGAVAACACRITQRVRAGTAFSEPGSRGDARPLEVLGMKSLERGLILAGAMALGLALSSGAARAEDEFNRPGPYVGVGGSYMVSGFQGGAANGDFGDTLGFNARGGYRLNDFWALEGIYEYGDDFGARQVAPGASIQTNAFTVNGKLMLPLGRFQPYLEGGVGFVNANADRSLRETKWNVDGTNFAGRFGAGVDVYATENIALYTDAAYTIPIGDVNDLYHFSFGWGAKYVF
jgi:opacity protein-like surface antigen